MSQYYGTEAIILASRDLGESDRLITFYTRDLGRIDAVAKGVKLAKSKLRGHLNLFSRLRIMLTQTRDSWRLLDAETIPYHEERFGLATKNEFARFLIRVLAEPIPDPEVWSILSRFEKTKSKGQLFFEKVRILDALGMFPNTGVLTGSTLKRIETNDHEGFIPSPTEEAMIEKIITHNI